MYQKFHKIEINRPSLLKATHWPTSPHDTTPPSITLATTLQPLVQPPSHAPFPRHIPSPLPHSHHPLPQSPLSSSPHPSPPLIHPPHTTYTAPSPPHSHSFSILPSSPTTAPGNSRDTLRKADRGLGRCRKGGPGGRQGRRGRERKRRGWWCRHRFLMGRGGREGGLEM